MSKYKFLMLVTKLIQMGYKVSDMEVVKAPLTDGIEYLELCIHCAIPVRIPVAHPDNTDKKFHEFTSLLEMVQLPFSEHDHI